MIFKSRMAALGVLIAAFFTAVIDPLSWFGIRISLNDIVLVYGALWIGVLVVLQYIFRARRRV